MVSVNSDSRVSEKCAPSSLRKKVFIANPALIGERGRERTNQPFLPSLLHIPGCGADRPRLISPYKRGRDIV